MKKSIFVGVLLLGMAMGGTSTAFAESTSVTTSVDQMSALMKQIEMLQTQIAELKKANEGLKADVSQLRDELKIARTLRQGDKGDDVKLLQQMLSTDPSIYSGEVTGYYGPKTAEAMKHLQEKMGLERVGNVGPKTLEKLNQLLLEGAGKSGKIPPGLLKQHGKGLLVNLKPVGESGVKGFAALSFTKLGTTTSVTGSTTGSVKVRIELWDKQMKPMLAELSSTSPTSTPTTTARPAHIHSGTCASTGAVKWALNPVVNGRSETVVDVSLHDLLNGPYYVNVHKSATELQTTISCGDIKSAASVWKERNDRDEDGIDDDEEDDEDDDD